MFGARASGTSRKPATVEDVVVGRVVRYGRRRGTVGALGYGELRDGTRIPICNVRFEDGHVQTVLVSQLELI